MHRIDVHKLADEAKFNSFHGLVLAWCVLIIIIDGYDLAVAGIGELAAIAHGAIGREVPDVDGVMRGRVDEEQHRAQAAERDCTRERAGERCSERNLDRSNHRPRQIERVRRRRRRHRELE